MGAQPLSQRVIGDELAELGDQRGVLLQPEVGIDAVLERDHASLPQADGRTQRELAVGELGQGRTAPQGERGLQRLTCADGVACVEPSGAFVRQDLEPPEVHLVGADVQPVAGRIGHEPRRCVLGVAVRFERTPQPRDVALERSERRCRRVVAPQRVDQRVGGDRPAASHCEHRDDEPRLRSPQVDDLSVDAQLERPEDRDLYRRRAGRAVLVQVAGSLSDASPKTAPAGSATTAPRPKLMPVGSMNTAPPRSRT